MSQPELTARVRLAPHGRDASNPSGRWVPDIFVHLELKADLQFVLENPLDQLSRFQLPEDRGKQNWKALTKTIPLEHLLGPDIVFAVSDYELDFVIRLKLVDISV